MLRGFGGGEYVSTRKLNALIIIDGQKFNANMVVVSDGLICENVLLGMDVLCGSDKRLIIENVECRVEQIRNICDPQGLDENQQQQFDNIMCEYRGVFAENIKNLGKCRVSKMAIKLKSDQPIQLKPYRVPFAKRPIITQIITELLENEIIRPSESQYSSPVVLVEKRTKNTGYV